MGPEESGNPGTAAVAESPAQGTNQATGTERGTEKPQETTPFFFQKPSKEAKGEEVHVDPTKLPPELQPFYKSMQADYTRKTQEAAEMRRTLEAERKAFEDSQRMFREYLDRTVAKPNEPVNQQTDVASQIRSLREEGRHDEADAILLQVAQSQAQAQLDPLRQQAEVANRQATFRDIVSDLKFSNPVVATYGKEIAQVFDSPDMSKLRTAILSSSDAMRDFLPMTLDLIGARIHAARLERDFPEMVEREVTKRLTAEKSKAMGVPARLVESGGASRVSGSPKGVSLDQAINNAIARYS